MSQGMQHGLWCVLLGAEYSSIVVQHSPELFVLCGHGHGAVLPCWRKLLCTVADYVAVRRLLIVAMRLSSMSMQMGRPWACCAYACRIYFPGATLRFPLGICKLQASLGRLYVKAR
jgi:hypothetical protein